MNLLVVAYYKTLKFQVPEKQLPSTKQLGVRILERPYNGFDYKHLSHDLPVKTPKLICQNKFAIYAPVTGLIYPVGLTKDKYADFVPLAGWFGEGIGILSERFNRGNTMMFEDAGNIWDDAERLATEAYEHYENGRMEQAYRQLSEAIDINPDNPSWLFNAGLTLDAMGRFDEAIDLFDRALHSAGEDVEILNCIAVDLTRTGMYDKALDVFSQIEQINPEFEPCYCNRIITYAEMDDHEKAEQMFYLAQQIKEDCPICFYNIGNSLYSRGQFQKAAWCWEKTLQIDPEHPQINYRIAQAHWANGNTKLAKVHFLEELRNNSKDMSIVIEFGVFLLLRGELDAAKEKFNRVLEMEPDNSKAMLYLGDLELSRKNFAAAERWYTQAADNEPCMCGPKFRLAQIAYQQDDFPSAKDYIHEELMYSPEDAEVLITMGDMLLAMGEVDDATDCFLKVVDEDPQNGRAFAKIAACLLARKEAEPEGAVQFFEHARSLGYDRAWIIDGLIKLHLFYGDAQMAQRTLAGWQKDHPKDKTFRFTALKIKYAKVYDVVWGTFLLKWHMLKGRTKTTARRLITKFRS